MRFHIRYNPIYGILFFLFVCLVILIHLQLANYAYDDAYIHFRIARNFLEYGAPYFNINEPVMTSSSSGWTILVTFLFLLFGPNIHTISIFNAFSLIAGLLLVFFINKHYLISNYRILFLVSIYFAFLLKPSVGLMETSFTLMVGLFAIFLYVKRADQSLILFGILPFFRLELSFLSFWFLLFAWFQKRFAKIKIISYPLFGGIPIILYDLFFFHTLIPNSISAKISGYKLSWWDAISQTLQQLIPSQDALSSTLIVFLIIFIIFPIVSFFLFRNRSMLLSYETPLLLSGVSIIIFYIVGRSLVFPWYVPLYTIPVALPIFRIMLDRAKLLSKLILLVLAIPVLIIVPREFIAAAMDPALSDEFQVNARTRKYIEIGQDLYEAYPNACLMSSEIGGLGWGFKGYIIDAFGLASPEAIKYHSGKYGNIGEIPIAYIKEKKPDLIVSLEVFEQDFSKEDLSNQYSILEEPIYVKSDLAIAKSSTLWGSNSIDIFIRKRN